MREAWRDERVPLANAIVFADGEMILLEVERDSAQTTTVRALGRTTLASFLSFNPNWWAHVTPLAELRTPSGDLVLIGEGSQGGDGFIALCEENGELEYCAFFTRSNPFVSVSLSGDSRRAIASNNLGERWSLDLDRPWDISVTPAAHRAP